MWGWGSVLVAAQEASSDLPVPAFMHAFLCVEKWALKHLSEMPPKASTTSNSGDDEL